LPNPGGNNNANNALGYNYQYNKYGEGNTGRPDYAQNIYDSSLDRAWTYDQVGRLKEIVFRREGLFSVKPPVNDEGCGLSRFRLFLGRF
jgi:hypothetical protein